MTEGQKITAMTSALRQEAHTLFSHGNRSASNAITDYLNECTEHSLVRLHDLISAGALVRARYE